MFHICFCRGGLIRDLRYLFVFQGGVRERRSWLGISATLFCADKLADGSHRGQAGLDNGVGLGACTVSFDVCTCHQKANCLHYLSKLFVCSTSLILFSSVWVFCFVIIRTSMQSHRTFSFNELVLKFSWMELIHFYVDKSCM